MSQSNKATVTQKLQTALQAIDKASTATDTEERSKLLEQARDATQSAVGTLEQMGAKPQLITSKLEAYSVIAQTLDYFPKVGLAIYHLTHSPELSDTSRSALSYLVFRWLNARGIQPVKRAEDGDYYTLGDQLQGLGLNLFDSMELSEELKKQQTAYRDTDSTVHTLQ